MTTVPQIPSSISPALPGGNPELISANELNQWADREDSKTAFPELVRRLLAQTPGITSLDMRAHEGTSAPGWDGSAASTGSAYLPAGELRFELGTNKQVKRKADSDYVKRTQELGDEARQYVYIFATPRNWPKGQQWADEHRKEQKFADIKVIDAHTLEGWLQATPAVHYWISERLGLQPRGATMFSAWWDRFQKELNTTIPLQFFRARRDEQAEKLLNELQTDDSNKPASIETTCAEDALAFTYAALSKQHEIADRSVFVTDRTAWSRLVESKTPLLLIPHFDNPDIGAAMDRGHRVLTIIDNSTEYSSDDHTISLPKIGRQEAAEVLRQEGADFRDAERLAALARRSITAFIRSISRNPVKQKPAWLSDAKTAAILTPLVLVGAWEDGNTRDEELIQSFVGTPIRDIRRLLVTLSQQTDAPFVQSGGLWRLVDPVDAARLLLPGLEPEVVQRWDALVRDMLLADDPYRNLGTTERLEAQLRGVHPGRSNTLRDHVAEGLVLAALSSNELARTASAIVQRLLDEAFADDTGQTLATLAPVLPTLAEAAPDELLAVILADFDKPIPIVRTLFQESGSGIFGPSSLHPHLLWALENLCWSSDYYGRSAMALAALVDVDIDRDDRRGNRPIESLEKITVGWTTQSAANIDDKIKVLQAINRRYPEVGWELTLLLLQPSHSSIISSTGPRYRDWELPSGPVTYDEMAKFHAALADEIVAAATSRADRWTALINAGNRIPAEARAKIFDHLAHEVPVGSWNSEDRHTVWASLTQQIHDQQCHADADWAMTSQELEQMQEIAQSLEDPNDPRRYSPLFRYDAYITVNGLRRADERFKQDLDQARCNAIRSVAGAGIDAFRTLIEDVERPDLVGAHLAITGSLDDESIISWIDDESVPLQKAASCYVWNRLDDGNFDWLTALRTTGLSPEGKKRLVATMPMAKAYWTQVASLDNSLVVAYWSNANCWHIPDEEQTEAVALLLQHGLPWRALTVLEHVRSRQLPCDRSLVKKVLTGLLEVPPDIVTQDHSYAVSEVLTWLESAVPNDTDLPGLEFQFFDFIPDHEPSDALYRALGANPIDFVHLVKSAYRADDDTQTTSSQDMKEPAYAERVWSVLWHWSRVPGLRDDGSIDTEHLTSWVAEARSLLDECGHAKIGDTKIGDVLSRCPAGRDSVWPAEEIRDLLESLKSPEIENGFSMGRYNQRGGSVRGVYDGGVQERALAHQYESDAKKLELKWPRTAAILRIMARSYETDAQHLDMRDERDADEG